MDADVHARMKHDPGHRDHHQPGDNRLNRSSNYLLDCDPGNINRGEQAVFDFTRPLKFCDERHGYGPDSGEHHGDGDDAGKQQALVRVRHVAAADHHPAKYENKEQWLQKCLKYQLKGISPRHMRITRQHC